MSALTAPRIFFAAWWAALAVATSIGLALLDTWYDEQRVVALLLTGVAALAMSLRPATRPAKRSLAWVFFFGLGLLSVAGARYPMLAAVDWSLTVLAVLGLARFRDGYRDDPILLTRGLALGALAIATVQVIGVASNYVAALGSGGITPEVWVTGFSNRRFPAHLQALLLPLLPAAVALLPRPAYRQAAWVMFALWFMCWIGSGARGAWVALLGAAVGVALWPAPGRALWLKRMGLACTLGAVGFVVFFVLMPWLLSVGTHLENRLSDPTTLSARDIVWGQALRMIADHPWLGVGPMHYATVINGYGAHPHDLWLQLAAEWGLPAMILAFALAARTLWGAWHALRRPAGGSAAQVEPDDLARLGIASAALAWFLYVLVDGLAVVPTSVLTAIPVLGAAAAMAADGQATSTLGWRGRMGMLALTLFACAALANVSRLGLADRHAREAWYRAKTGSDWFNPRFWQQGWLRPEDALPRQRAPARAAP